MKHVTQQQKQKINQKLNDEKKIESMQQSPINCTNKNRSTSAEIDEEKEEFNRKDSITVLGSQRKASLSFIPLPSPSRSSNKSSIFSLNSPIKESATNNKIVSDTASNSTVSNIPILARNRSSREELLKQRKESSAERKRSSALLYSGQNGSIAAVESDGIEDREDWQEGESRESKDENGMSKGFAANKREDTMDDDIVIDSMNTTGSQIQTSRSMPSITKHTSKANYTDFGSNNNEDEMVEEEEEEEERDALSDSLLPLKGLQSHIDDFGELIDALHTEIETADVPDIEDAHGVHTLSMAGLRGEIDNDLLANSLTQSHSYRGGVDNCKQSTSPGEKLSSNIIDRNISAVIIPSGSVSAAESVIADHIISKVALKNQSNLQQPKKRLDRGQVVSGGGVDVADMLRNFNRNNDINNDISKNDKKSSVNGSSSTLGGKIESHDFQYTDIYGGKSSSADLIQYPINEIQLASTSQKSPQNLILRENSSTSFPPSVRDLLSLTPLPGSERNSQNINRGAHDNKNDERYKSMQNGPRKEAKSHEVVKEEQQGREMMGRKVEVDRRRQLEKQSDVGRGGGEEEVEEEENLEEVETSQYLVQQERYTVERRKRKEEQKGKSLYREKLKNGLMPIENRILKKLETKIGNKASDGRKRLEKIQVDIDLKVVNKDKIKEEVKEKNGEEIDIVEKEVSHRNRKLSRSSREQEEEEEALIEELLELEKRQSKSMGELQKITDTDYDSVSKSKKRGNRSNRNDDSISLSQSDKEGSTKPSKGASGVSGRSGNSTRPEADREKQNKLAFGPGARDVRKVEKADYRAFADHAAVARVSASHNIRGGLGARAGNLWKEREKERSPVQAYVSRDSDARNERRQRRILRERGRETDDDDEDDEEVNDDDLRIQQKGSQSTHSIGKHHENNRHIGSDSEKERERERNRDSESGRGKHNSAGLRGIPESRQMLAPLVHHANVNSSHIDGDGDMGGGGEGYLSEYQRKNVKIKVKNLNRRHSEMVSEFRSDDESQPNSMFKSAVSRGRQGGSEEDGVLLPALRPPPPVYHISHQHPLDSNRHAQREREREKKGRLTKASSAPSRLVQGGTPVNDSAAFESESVSTLPPPVRVSHDYGSSSVNLLRPLQNGSGAGFGPGRKVR